MSGKKIVLTLEVGHRASILREASPEGFTHEWEVYVQGSNDVNIEHLVEKVVFHLHESFAKTRRSVRSAPFHVKERGYGSFMMAMDIYFKTPGELQKARVNYDLYLQKIDIPSIQNKVKENVTFFGVSNDFRRKLLAAGATETLNHEESKLDDKSGMSRPSSGAKTKPRHHVTKHMNSSSASEATKKIKHTEMRKEPPKSKELKPSEDFTTIFGEIVMPGKQDSKSKKDKSKKSTDKPEKPEKSSGSSKVKEKSRSDDKRKSYDKRDSSKHKSSKEKDRKSSHKSSHRSSKSSVVASDRKKSSSTQNLRKESPVEHRKSHHKGKSDKSKHRSKPNVVLSPKKLTAVKIATPNVHRAITSPKKRKEMDGPKESPPPKRAKTKSPAFVESLPSSPRSRSPSLSISSSSDSESKKVVTHQRSSSHSRKSSISTKSSSSSSSRSVSREGSSSRCSSSSGESRIDSHEGGPLEQLIYSRGLVKSVSPEMNTKRKNENTPQNSSWKEDKNPTHDTPNFTESPKTVETQNGLWRWNKCKQSETTEYYIHLLSKLHVHINDVFNTGERANIKKIVDIVSDEKNLEVSPSGGMDFFQFDLMTTSPEVINKLKDHFEI